MFKSKMSDPKSTVGHTELLDCCLSTVNFFGIIFNPLIVDSFSKMYVVNLVIISSLTQYSFPKMISKTFIILILWKSLYIILRPSITYNLYIFL